MRSIMDWILEKMKLVEEEEEGEDEEREEAGCEQIFFKKIAGYEDCNVLIEHYKAGTACIFRVIPGKNADAQGMMNYICGGIYALGGAVMDIGGNLYMALMGERVDCK